MFGEPFACDQLPAVRATPCRRTFSVAMIAPNHAPRIS